MSGKLTPETIGALTEEEAIEFVAHQGERQGRSVPGLGLRARSYYIWVIEYGIPDRTEGGLILGDVNFSKYRMKEERYGEVVSVGPGRYNKKGKFVPLEEPDLGDVVMFSRKHGSRLVLQFDHPKFGPCFIRVIDPDQCMAVLPGFEPWWPVGECQTHPGVDMSG